MRQKEFFDNNQASSYLTHSVIRLGGSPIYIQKVSRERDREGTPRYKLYYYPLGRVGQRDYMDHVWSDHKDIDMNPVPLGMLAPGKESAATTYCCRIPRRAWKIGLTHNSLNLSQVDRSVDKRIRFRASDVLISTSLANTIMGEYPSLSSAKALSVDRGVPVAFSRAFSVWNDDLYYKDIGTPVGQISNKKPTLFDEFYWLNEKLDEDLNG